MKTLQDTNMKTPLKLIEEFQCPGCIHGINPKTCQKFELNKDVLSCANHHPSTFASGIGRIALGLPKGFNRIGQLEFLPNTCYIRLYEKEPPKYDKFNIPVWAMEQDGFLFVRCYCPRINATFVDVIQGGKLKDAPGAINVGEFWGEID